MSQELFETSTIPSTTLDQIFAEGKIILNPRIVGGTAENMSFVSASSGARVEIFPETDFETGMAVYDDDGNVVLKTVVTGTDVGDVIIGDYSGGQGIKYDKSAGTLDIQGGVSVDELHIPDENTTASSFHTDEDGNTWWGCTHDDFTADNDNATAYILKTGVVKFQNALITGDSCDFINNTLDTSSKKILSDFDFGTTDYAGALKTGDIAWNTTTGAITGGSGVVVYRKGIVGAASGVATFSIDATTGSATFAGTLSAASGTLGSITIGTNAWHIDSSGNMWWGSSGTYAAATNKISSTGLYQGTFQGGYKTDSNQFFNIVGTSVNSYLGMTNSSQTLRLKYSSGVPVIEINQTVGSSVSHITLSNTGSSSAALINLTQDRNDSVDAYGIKMDLENIGDGTPYAFHFAGDEVTGGSVGGTQDKKIRINIAGTDYYIPCHTS